MSFWDNIVDSIGNEIEDQNDRRIETRKNINAFLNVLPRDVKLNIEEEYYNQN